MSPVSVSMQDHAVSTLDHAVPTQGHHAVPRSMRPGAMPGTGRSPPGGGA